MENTSRYNPASASSYSFTCNQETDSFLKDYFSDTVKGTDEWLLKHDSIDRASEWSTKELTAYFMVVNYEKPQDAYRERLANLGFWPKSLKAGALKPVNAKECQQRGGEYARRARMFETIRKAGKLIRDNKQAEIAAIEAAKTAETAPLTAAVPTVTDSTETPAVQTVPAISAAETAASILANARLLIEQLSSDKKASKAEILAAFSETIDCFELVS